MGFNIYKIIILSKDYYTNLINAKIACNKLQKVEFISGLNIQENYVIFCFYAFNIH